MRVSLLLWAIGPAVVLMHVVYLLDRKSKEPVRNMVRYFGAGAISALVAGLVEYPLIRGTRILGIPRSLGRFGWCWWSSAWD